MTTTELIKLLKSVEFGASGRPREISISTENEFYPNPEMKIFGTGDGIAGAELCLSVRGEHIFEKDDSTKM